VSESADCVAALDREREQEDQFYAEHPPSPIPEAHREGFDGLQYYDPEPAYRFELSLERHEDPEIITLETTTDGTREYYWWGEFRFGIDGTEQTLRAYRADPDADRLWVPFRDATSGETTYGAGRYLDLEAEEHRTAEGRWILDFNRAYNPYCAYSEEYECPLIPMENWLDVPIRAGERAYEPPEGATSHAH
jgi:uncharacterized protein (DUF1684 family)